MPLWLLLAAAISPGDHAAEATAGSPDACGRPYTGFRPSSETYFVATASGDTVPTSDGDVYAQVVTVAKLGGPGGETTQLMDGTAGALLIPWGFDEQCQPIPWSGSWVWSTPGGRGFYRGQLRPRNDWVGNRPTFDVFGAAWEGFPASPWNHPMATGMPKLTADELYDLYDRLPTREELVAGPYGAVSDLVEWRRAAGAVADRYPAPRILEAAFEVAEVVRVRQSPIPFAGTYRITVEDEGETLASFWLRTGESGAAPWAPTRAAGPREVAASPAPAGAVAAPAALALRVGALEDLTSACSRATALSGTETISEIDDIQGWRAELAPEFVASCFAGDAVLSRLVRPPTPSDADIDSVPFSGAFRREDDGRLTFRQQAALADGTIVELRGERIDVRTLPAVDPLEGWSDDRVLGQSATGADPGQLN